MKFVLQKSYFDKENVSIDYRYSIIIYVDKVNNMIEIRYDSLKYDESSMIRDLYGKIVQQCIEWIKNKLKVDLFVCKYDSIVDVIKYNQEGDVKIYKQMMELS